VTVGRPTLTVDGQVGYLATNEAKRGGHWVVPQATIDWLPAAAPVDKNQVDVALRDDASLEELRGLLATFRASQKAVVHFPVSGTFTRPRNIPSAQVAPGATGLVVITGGGA
jgi:hypothetical protein